MEDANEAANLEILRATKRRVLAEYDQQAEAFGLFTPPHVQIERKRLREELGLVESVMRSPLGASIGDELGERNRYISYIEEVRGTKQIILEAFARLEERFDHVEQASGQWRWWGTRAFIVIIVAVVVIAILLSYVMGRMG